jgi:hypothetical protein
MRVARDDAPMPLICPTCQIAKIRYRVPWHRRSLRKSALRLRQIKDRVEGQALMVRVLLHL